MSAADLPHEDLAIWSEVDNEAGTQLEFTRDLQVLNHVFSGGNESIPGQIKASTHYFESPRGELEHDRHDAVAWLYRAAITSKGNWSGHALNSFVTSK